jgi:hypothetical protein
VIFALGWKTGAVSTVILVKKMGRESQRWFTSPADGIIPAAAGIIAGAFQRGCSPAWQGSEDALCVSASPAAAGCVFHALKQWKPLPKFEALLTSCSPFPLWQEYAKKRCSDQFCRAVSKRISGWRAFCGIHRLWAHLLN